MNYKRTDILTEYTARYNRGDIGKEQYLNQKKALLKEEKAEKDIELQALTKTVSSLAEQIAEVDAELQELLKPTQESN